MSEWSHQQLLGVEVMGQCWEMQLLPCFQIAASSFEILGGGEDAVRLAQFAQHCVQREELRLLDLQPHLVSGSGQFELQAEPHSLLLFALQVALDLVLHPVWGPEQSELHLQERTAWP